MPPLPDQIQQRPGHPPLEDALDKNLPPGGSPGIRSQIDTLRSEGFRVRHTTTQASMGEL